MQFRVPNRTKILFAILLALILFKFCQFFYRQGSFEVNNLGQREFGALSMQPSNRSSFHFPRHCPPSRMPFEAHWPRLAAVLKDYAEWHENTTKTPSESTRYILLAASYASGTGNQLLALISAFTIALITQRVLLLEDQGSLSAT